MKKSIIIKTAIIILNVTFAATFADDQTHGLSLENQTNDSLELYCNGQSTPTLKIKERDYANTSWSNLTAQKSDSIGNCQVYNKDSMLFSFIVKVDPTTNQASLISNYINNEYEVDLGINTVSEHELIEKRTSMMFDITN